MTNTNFLQKSGNYSVSTAAVSNKFSITTIPQLVAAKNLLRNHIIVQNNEPLVDIYVAYTSTMVYGQGERLAQWDTWKRQWTTNSYLGDVYVVTSFGTAACTVIEFSDVQG